MHGSDHHYLILEQKSIIRAKYVTGRVKKPGRFDLEGLRQPRRLTISADEDLQGRNVPGFLLLLLRILLV